MAEGENNISFLEADSVVLACGMRPDNDLREQLQAAGFEKCFPIGDCLEPRRMRYAMAEAFQTASTA